MTDPRQLTDDAVQRLQAVLQGPVLTPADKGYDRARRVWNGHIDRRPSLIARCSDPQDVVAAVHFARDGHLLTAVRSGGHSFAGFSVCDGGMVIDLSLMKGILVDPVRRTVTVEAGVTWGELDTATQALGLAVTGGLITHTGVAGLTLGGGIGWLMRKHGLTCDNLLSAEVVTAEGRRLTASPEQNSELFWGLRGGGGNFGIVTSFEFRLHEVGPVLGGLVFHHADEGPGLLRAYRDFVVDLTDEIATMLVYLCAPPLPFVPKHLQGQPGWAFVVCGLGPIEEAEHKVAPMWRFGYPLFEVIGPMRYTELQSMFDASAPWGISAYVKSNYRTAMSDTAIDELICRCAAMPAGPSQIHIHHMGGAVARVDEDDTAFSGRAAMFCDNFIAMWNNGEDGKPEVEWVRGVWEAMQPYATRSVYVNFTSEPESRRLFDGYGHRKYGRLARLKARYDPGDLFCLNQNIPPTVETEGAGNGQGRRL